MEDRISFFRGFIEKCDASMGMDEEELGDGGGGEAGVESEGLGMGSTHLEMTASRSRPVCESTPQIPAESVGEYPLQFGGGGPTDYEPVSESDPTSNRTSPLTPSTFSIPAPQHLRTCSNLLLPKPKVPEFDRDWEWIDSGGGGGEEMEGLEYVCVEDQERDWFMSNLGGGVKRKAGWGVGRGRGKRGKVGRVM